MFSEFDGFDVKEVYENNIEDMFDVEKEMLDDIEGLIVMIRLHGIKVVPKYEVNYYAYYFDGPNFDFAIYLYFNADGKKYSFTNLYEKASRSWGRKLLKCTVDYTAAFRELVEYID